VRWRAALQRLCRWERAAPKQVVLTQPMGNGVVRDFTWAELIAKRPGRAARSSRRSRPTSDRLTHSSIRTSGSSAWSS
jgi:hypothetical protein